VIDEAREHIREIDPNQLNRFDRFLDDCLLELIDNPSKQQVEQNRDLVWDETDVPVALTAINAGVDYFVTYDRDFTDGARGRSRPIILLPPVFLRDELSAFCTRRVWSPKNGKRSREVLPGLSIR
jgi:hypothetical protein